MNIEEAIKTLKVLIGLEEFNKLSYKENKAIETLLTSYEKQQKEIEELKEENKEIREWKYVIDNPIDLKKLSELDLIKIFGKSYIAEDKIKAKIEEINKEMLNEENSLELFYRKKYCKEALQSLLEKE